MMRGWICNRERETICLLFGGGMLERKTRQQKNWFVELYHIVFKKLYGLKKTKIKIILKSYIN